VIHAASRSFQGNALSLPSVGVGRSQAETKEIEPKVCKNR